MIGTTFADHYEYLADWLAGLLEVDITAGKIRVLQDTTYDGRVMVIDLERNFAVQLEVTTYKFNYVKDLIDATVKGKIRNSMEHALDKLKKKKKKSASVH